jgi:amino acid transporter
VLNLRGLGDAARAFLLPTMVFIVGLLVIIVIGLIHPLALNAPQPGVPLVPRVPLETVSVLLLLKAFSAGCSALTGVEAIANGVPQFKEPRVQRAKRTEMLLGTILGVMLLGLAVLADRWHIGPRSGQTVLSQIMAMAVGRNWAYYVMSLTITLVLALAANTSFGGLPVLASLLAKDHYLPHLFSLRDDRQVFAPRPLALRIPAQPLRPGPVRRAARSPRRRHRPGLDPPGAGRRRGSRRLPVTWNARGWAAVWVVLLTRNR